MPLIYGTAMSDKASRPSHGEAPQVDMTGMSNDEVVQEKRLPIRLCRMIAV